MRLTIAMMRALERVAERGRGTRGLPVGRGGLHPIALRSCIKAGLVVYDPAFPDGRLSEVGIMVLDAFRLGRRRWA